MAVLADFLRDSSGTLYRVYPSTDGELVINDGFGDPSGLDSWTDPSYTIPSAYHPTYRTLSDSSGNTWYVYVSLDMELIISDSAPTAMTGIWYEPDYGVYEKQATTGDEIYLLLKDIDEVSWYVYPDENGELTITNTQPS